MRERKETISTSKLILLLLISLLMGTVFVFGKGYWHASISREQAISKEASYTSCHNLFNRPSRYGLTLYFSGLEPMQIDASCINESFLNEMKLLPAGEKVRLLIHPNSNTILEMEADGNTFLQFESCMECLTLSPYCFQGMGIAMYIIFFAAAIKLLRNYRRKRQWAAKKAARKK